MRIILASLIILCFYNSFCQSSNPFMEDGNGRPLYVTSNYIAEGSPYFIDGYYPAQLTAVNGNVFNVRVKINIANKTVQYLAADGKEMVTEMPVKKILFTNFPGEDGNLDEVLLESFPGAFSAPGAAVYEVLVTGKISLLKKITISYRDDKKYNEASTTRIFERKETYCSLHANGEIKKLEKGKPALLELFTDKKAEVASFIDQYKLSSRNEKDYKDIFRFYNTLNP